MQQLTLRASSFNWLGYPW